MEQETLEFSLSTVEENYDLRMELLQGNTDRKFYITLRDENKKINLSKDAKVSVIVAYDPRYANDRWQDKGGFTYDESSQDYKIDILVGTMNGDTFSVVEFQMQERFVSFVGRCSMTIGVKDKTNDGVDIEFYTTPKIYTVKPNIAYNDVFSNDNRETFNKMVGDIKHVNGELNKKVNLDLSNLTPQEKASFRGDKGEKGDKGDTGDRGFTGARGEAGVAGAVGATGATGKDGKSAYDVWLSQGNSGKTRADFIASLKGEAGESVYQTWLDDGNVGDIEDFIMDMRGHDGKNGVDGKDGKDGKDGAVGAKGDRGTDATGGEFSITGDNAVTSVTDRIHMIGSIVRKDEDLMVTNVSPAPFFTIAQGLYYLSENQKTDGGTTGDMLEFNQRAYDYIIKSENGIVSVYSKGKYGIMLVLDSDSLVYQNEPNSDYVTPKDFIQANIQMKTEEGNVWEDINCNPHGEVSDIRATRLDTFRGRRILHTSCAFTDDGGEIRVRINNEFNDAFVTKGGMGNSCLLIYKIEENGTDQFDYDGGLEVYRLFKEKFYNPYKLACALYEPSEGDEKNSSVKI